MAVEKHLLYILVKFRNDVNPGIKIERTLAFAE